jgi:hypothetical protein
MRVWTIQDKAAYVDLCQKGVLRCDPKLAFWLTDKEFKFGYDWLVDQMKQQIGKPPKGVKYPIWAWYRHFGENKKIDLRRYEFRNYIGEYYVIEAEIDENCIVLGDEEMWHYVLNQWYLCKDADKDEITKVAEDDDAWFDNLPSEEQLPIMISSWEKIFDKNSCPWEFVQATFWELRKEQVISVRYFKGRGKRK